MRFMGATFFLAMLSSAALAQTTSESYWIFEQNDGHAWCGYTSMAEFAQDVQNSKPAETARATYSSGKLVELTYQVEPESGDWIVVDKYVPSDEGLTLRRANLLAQPKLQVIEEAYIHHGKAGPFHIVSTSTLDGKKADTNVELPNVVVWTQFSGTPMLAVISEMRTKSITKLCKAF